MPDDGFYIEVDHFSWHGGRYVTTYDHRRDRKMRRRGFQVERVTDTDLDHHLADAVEDLWELWQQCRRDVDAAVGH